MSDHDKYMFMRRLAFTTKEESPCDNSKIKRYRIVGDPFFGSESTSYSCPNQKELYEFHKLTGGSSRMKYSYYGQGNAMVYDELTLNE